jgi:hypothetical protein
LKNPPCCRLSAHWTWTMSNGTASMDRNLLEGVGGQVDGGGEGEHAVERRAARAAGPVRHR